MGEDIEPYKDYDALVLPGGWGAADTMKADKRVLELVKYYAGDPNKYMCAMCAAPAVLAAAGVSRGKTLTSYPDRKSTRLNSSHRPQYLVCRLLLEKNVFLMIRRPPRSTLFPTRRSSDLQRQQRCLDRVFGRG